MLLMSVNKHSGCKSRGTTESDNMCRWDPVKVITIPESAYFADYSDMAFNGNRLAITSQVHNLPGNYNGNLSCKVYALVMMVTGRSEASLCKGDPR